jgi:hypothetical protein
MTTAERIRKAVGAIENVDAATLDDAELAIAAIVADAVAEALPRWVPVGERLPEYGVDVDVTRLGFGRRQSSGVVLVARRREECGCYGAEACACFYEWQSDGAEELVENVTAWRPRPAPWVERGEL